MSVNITAIVRGFLISPKDYYFEEPIANSFINSPDVVHAMFIQIHKFPTIGMLNCTTPII